MLDHAEIATHTLSTPEHPSVPFSLLTPRHSPAQAICLFLFGGGGSLQSLSAIAPLLSRGFGDGSLPPMAVACAGVPPFCFYLDDPQRGAGWETLVAQELPNEARERVPSATATLLVGISMGGYGALKIAFQQPQRFAAVAAVAPMLEPSLDAHNTPLRNRFHYPGDVPQALLGPQRDAALFEQDHPGNRARRNATALRQGTLAIRLDAGSRDACNAHDGCEHLHRLLWDLDVVHEYHLLRDADHADDSLPQRLGAAFAFVGSHIGRRPRPSSQAQALRAALQPRRERAAQVDPTINRVYGQL